MLSAAATSAALRSTRAIVAGRASSHARSSHAIVGGSETGNSLHKGMGARSWHGAGARCDRRESFVVSPTLGSVMRPPCRRRPPFGSASAVPSAGARAGRRLRRLLSSVLPVLTSAAGLSPPSAPRQPREAGFVFTWSLRILANGARDAIAACRLWIARGAAGVFRETSAVPAGLSRLSFGRFLSSTFVRGANQTRRRRHDHRPRPCGSRPVIRNVL